MAIGAHTLRRKSNRPLPDRKERKQDKSFLPTRKRNGAAWREFLVKFKNVISWILIMPVCTLSFVAFAKLIVRASKEGSLWMSPEFIWFILGAGAWLICFALLRRLLLIVYVFGHEWSHLLAAKMCGAVVYDWHVGRDGGWVDTNKSNTFISLAPYLVPFYTVAVLLVYGLVGLFVNLERVDHIALGSYVIDFDALKVLCTSIGFTWCFHFTYTLQTLRIEQSDVKRNGSSFSAWLILLCNLYIIVALLIAASPAVTWADVWNTMHTYAALIAHGAGNFLANMGQGVAGVAQEFLQALRTWKVH